MERSRVAHFHPLFNISNSRVALPAGMQTCAKPMVLHPFLQIHVSHKIHVSLTHFRAGGIHVSSPQICPCAHEVFTCQVPKFATAPAGIHTYGPQISARQLPGWPKSCKSLSDARQLPGWPKSCKSLSDAFARHDARASKCVQMQSWILMCSGAHTRVQMQSWISMCSGAHTCVQKIGRAHV